MMQLAPMHVKNSKGKKTVDCVRLATAYNTSLHGMFQSDPAKAPNLGLRLKSPAHVKDFFDRVDNGLEIGASLAGKIDEFVTVRRMLRDETASAVSPAARRDPLVETGLNSSFAESGDCGRNCDGGDNYVDNRCVKQKHNIDHDITKVRARRCCELCRAEGRGEWFIRKISGPGQSKNHCTNTVCTRYVPFESKEMASENPTSKKRRMCRSCKDSGKGDFELMQSGSARWGSFKLSCQNPDCSVPNGAGFSASASNIPI
jgi:hypothetical protein